MNELRKAVEMALEALEEINQRSVSREHAQLISENAITAIREALAQPEQEPVAKNEEGRITWLVDNWPQNCLLYTTPPASKPWVGLTDEEIYECERLAAFRYQRHKYSIHGQIITPADDPQWHFVGAIEAKLKEKNT